MTTESVKLLRAASSKHSVFLLKSIHENKDFKWSDITKMPERLNIYNNMINLIKSGLVKPRVTKYGIRPSGYDLTPAGLKILSAAETLEKTIIIA